MTTTTRKLAPHIRAIGELDNRALIVLSDLEGQRRRALENESSTGAVVQGWALAMAADYVIQATTGETLTTADVLHVMAAAYHHQ